MYSNKNYGKLKQNTLQSQKGTQLGAFLKTGENEMSIRTLPFGKMFREYERINLNATKSELIDNLINVEALEKLNFQDYTKHIPVKLGGLYLFYNKDNEVIYVGQTNDLKNRIRQHIRSFETKLTGNHKFVGEVEKIKVLFVANSLDRLFLEGLLIRHYKPINNREVKLQKSR